MTDYTIDQLINIQQIKQLLETHVRISGIPCGLMDNDANIIVGVGLQQVCTQYLWEHPGSFARCWRNDPEIRQALEDFSGDLFECRCGNGMINTAMPIVIEGNRLAVLFSGQFFYDDQPPDLAWFQQQAEEFGFDPESYLAAVHQVPLFSRSHVDTVIRFLHRLVQLLTEAGYANLIREQELEERKRIDRELLILTGAINNSTDAFFLIDDQHRLQYVNNAACRSLGYSREELLRMRTPDIDPDISPDALEKLKLSVLDEGFLKPLETRHRAKDGRFFPVEVSATPFVYDGATLSLSMARDITERKQAEQQIKLLNHALDNVHEGAFLIDFQGCFLYVNQEACRTLGYSRDELIGMTILDIDPDFSVDRMAKHFAELLEVKALTFETRHRTRNGQIFPVEISTNVFIFGGSSYLLALVRNITERKQAEEVLRRQEQKFRTLAENSPDSILRYTTECRCVYANPRIERILGIPTGGMLGKTPMELFPAGEYREYQDRIAEVIMTGNCASLEIVVPDTGAGVQHHHIRFTAEFGEDGGVIGVLVIGHDVTGCKQAEQEIRDTQQRLNDMALELTLSEERERRRIAIDLHDTLGQNLTLTRMKLGGLNRTKLSAEQSKQLSEIQRLTEDSINRVRSLTKLLCPPVLESAGLEAGLKWLARQLETDYGLQIAFSDDLQDKLVAREIQMELYTSVRELLINIAKHAGTSTACLSVCREADTLAIRVEDDGVGFDVATVLNTPSAEGFGLFTIRRRIIYIGGVIQITSKPGSGTEVAINVPLAKQAPPDTTTGEQP